MRLVMKCRGAELEDEIELATVIELTTRPMVKWWTDPYERFFTEIMAMLVKDPLFNTLFECKL